MVFMNSSRTEKPFQRFLKQSQTPVIGYDFFRIRLVTGSFNVLFKLSQKFNRCFLRLANIGIF